MKLDEQILLSVRMWASFSFFFNRRSRNTYKAREIDSDLKYGKT